MNSIKSVFTITLSTAMFLVMGLGCITLLGATDDKGAIVFCFFMGFSGISVGALAVAAEIESKYRNKPTATRKKSKSAESYAAPEKE